MTLVGSQDVTHAVNNVKIMVKLKQSVIVAVSKDINRSRCRWWHYNFVNKIQAMFWNYLWWLDDKFLTIENTSLFIETGLNSLHIRMEGSAPVEI